MRVPAADQEAALQAIVTVPARGVRRPLVVLPVDAEKTVVCAHLLCRRVGRAMLLTCGDPHHDDVSHL